MSLELSERVKIAYKKLKASVYFDKTQLPLRDQLIVYESQDIESHLETLVQNLTGSDHDWNTFIDQILSGVSILVYPKKLQEGPENTVILNSSSTPIRMEKPQFFIDLPVDGHVLGVLWVLSVGRMLDKNCEDDSEGMYEHSYGNRLKKNLVNPESGDITYSPHLFEPYFSQYESWRDHGLERAKERLNDKQDAVILTLDFKSFYYSVDMLETDFENFSKSYNRSELWIQRVNYFVYRVLRQYSDMIRPICSGTELSIADRTILPIGFLPSNILSNWVLTSFDNAVIKQWNPVYYGRYVDDIIIVDKVEKNSPLYKRARNKDETQQLTSDDVIELFLQKCERPVLQIYEKETCKKEKDDDITYEINTELFSSPHCHICVQNSKVKVFYFQSGATQALLKCFQTQIARNVSEFRMMPDMDRVLYGKDYSEIFNLRNSDSINKLRSVDGITINKFALSKFLGKYRKVCGLINDKKEENAFEKDLMVILDEQTLIDNYGVWERILEILVVNNRIKLLEQCALRILSAIRRLEIPEDKVHPNGIHVKDGLLRVFRAALCRTTALTWSAEINHVIEKIHETLSENSNQFDCSSQVLKLFIPDLIHRARLDCCRFRMINKYVLPLPIDCILNQLMGEDHPDIHLCELSENIEILDSEWVSNPYCYYPYMVTPQEISFFLLCAGICNGKIYNAQEHETELKRIYLNCNFPNIERTENHTLYELEEIKVTSFNSFNGLHSLNSSNIPDNNSHVIYVGRKDPCNYKNKLCVAIGNAELKVDNFKAALNKKPNRSYQRYRNLSKMLDAAIDQQVDLLVFPENYLPLEWLPTVSRFCANNQIGLITGIEHVLFGSKNPVVYNLTAVILPYVHNDQKFAHIFYHSKVRFSPEEKRQIEGHYCTCKEGNGYQLFGWHNVWFPVYCCYELASIKDRTLFHSYADMVVAVEWNKDIAYFSSIKESMCRDLLCYCIQANSSGPGDSRVLQPTKSELRDIIKTKGGKNPCILAADINVAALREFQSLHYSLQKDSGGFKPTPPDFDREILKRKQDGTLFQWFKENSF